MSGSAGRMSELDEKKRLGAAYLLQLGKSSFTRVEFEAKTGLDQTTSENSLRQLIEIGLLQQTDNEYSLQLHGRSKLKVVLTGGVYDILHVGHLAALVEAKSLGDILVVVVATDIAVETLKGRRPVFPEEDRRTIVNSLKPVDAAILGYEDVGMGYEQVIEDVGPDVIALGYDQDLLFRTFSELVRRKGLNFKIVRLPKFDKEKYPSSSAIRQRVLREPEQ